VNRRPDSTRFKEPPPTTLDARLVRDTLDAFLDTSGKRRLSTKALRVLLDAILPTKHTGLPHVANVQPNRTPVSWFVRVDGSTEWRSVLSVSNVHDSLARELLQSGGVSTEWVPHLITLTKMLAKTGHSYDLLRRQARAMIKEWRNEERHSARRSASSSSSSASMYQVVSSRRQNGRVDSFGDQNSNVDYDYDYLLYRERQTSSSDSQRSQIATEDIL
jgi:hypothetical protein